MSDIIRFLFVFDRHHIYLVLRELLYLCIHKFIPTKIRAHQESLQQKFEVFASEFFYFFLICCFTVFELNLKNLLLAFLCLVYFILNFNLCNSFLKSDSKKCALFFVLKTTLYWKHFWYNNTKCRYNFTASLCIIFQ